MTSGNRQTMFDLNKETNKFFIFMYNTIMSNNKKLLKYLKN